MPADAADWTALGLGRSIRLLHSVNPTVVRNTLRRLHIRFWHAPTARLVALLRHAGAPQTTLKLVKEIVDTCKICRMWTRPGPKSMTSTRLVTSSNNVVQWGILFHRRPMISHIMDECIRFAAGSIFHVRRVFIMDACYDQKRMAEIPEPKAWQ